MVNFQLDFTWKRRTVFKYFGTVHTTASIFQPKQEKTIKFNIMLRTVAWKSWQINQWDS